MIQMFVSFAPRPPEREAALFSGGAPLRGMSSNNRKDEFQESLFMAERLESQGLVELVLPTERLAPRTVNTRRANLSHVIRRKRHWRRDAAQTGAGTAARREKTRRSAMSPK